MKDPKVLETCDTLLGAESLLRQYERALESTGQDRQFGVNIVADGWGRWQIKLDRHSPDDSYGTLEYGGVEE